MQLLRHNTFVTTNHYAKVLEFTDLEAVHGSGSATLVILESSSSGFNFRGGWGNYNPWG